MTAKHFRLIAAILDELGEDADNLGVVSTIAYRMADAFANENPRFDRYRFLAACGLLLPPNEPN